MKISIPVYPVYTLSQFRTFTAVFSLEVKVDSSAFSSGLPREAHTSDKQSWPEDRGWAAHLRWSGLAGSSCWREGLLPEGGKTRTRLF